MTKAQKPAARAARILLHAGAPKTGTTSLAYHFHEHEVQLNAAGAFFPHRFAMRGDVDPLHRALVKSRVPNKRDAGIAEARARLAELLDEKPDARIIMSNESILGEPFEPCSAVFYPHAARVVPILEEIFTGYSVGASITIRDFVSFIPSYYVQQVRRGSSQSLTGFYEGIDTTTLCWVRPVEALRQAFGEGNVQVYDYADFTASPAEFVEDAFAGPLGVTLPPFPPETKRRNRSFGGLALSLARGSNYVLSKVRPNAGEATRRKIRRGLLTPLSHILPGQKPALPPDAMAELASRYAADRETLLG